MVLLDEDRELFQFGTVIGTHGLRGDLKVRPLTPGGDALREATAIVLRRGESAETYRLRKASVHKGNLLVRLEGLEDIESAEPLVGSEVLLPYNQLGELSEDEYYWHELQGMVVTDGRCGDLGTIDDILTTAAHDIYVVNGPRGEVLIPAVDEFITEVDMTHHRMKVDLPEGLVPERDDL